MPDMGEFQETFDRLGLSSKDVKKLWNVYYAADTDKSGCICCMEFFDLLKLDRSAYAEKCFSLMVGRAFSLVASYNHSRTA